MKSLKTKIALDRVITLRPAREHDACALWRLAALDSAEVPSAPLLVAEIDGHLSVALSLRDGTCIADPFIATGDVVSLMLARVQASGGSRRLRWPASRRSVGLLRLRPPALPS